MSAPNVIVEGIKAIKEIISNFTSTPPEIEEAKEALRADLQQYNKKQLIELLIEARIKSSVTEPSQKDLIFAIFKDERTTALTYDEMSETVLENLDTKLKYAPHNFSWWRSQFNTAGEELPPRMTAAERNKLDRKMTMEAIKNAAK